MTVPATTKIAESPKSAQKSCFLPCREVHTTKNSGFQKTRKNAAHDLNSRKETSFLGSKILLDIFPGSRGPGGGPGGGGGGPGGGPRRPDPRKKGPKSCFLPVSPVCVGKNSGLVRSRKKGHFHLNLRSETRFLGGKIRTWFSSTDLVTPVFPTLQKVCKTRVSFRFPGVFRVQNEMVARSRKTSKITRIPGRNTHFWGVK